MHSRRANPVCVLGVGRSGTSLLAEVIDRLGVDFGSKEAMLQPNELNPHGFWELVDINVLNDDIRAAWGGTPLEPPRVEPGWQHAPEMEAFRTRIEAVVASHFAGSRRWGFKHSGTTLTLPIWQSVVGEFDYVICVRNPLEVRASGYAARETLATRRNAKPARWELWAHCYCEVLRNTAGRRRAFVFHDEWFTDAEALVGRLADFLDVDGIDDRTRTQIAATVETELHRQRASDLELAKAEQIPVEVRALYFLMRDLAAAEARREPRATALNVVASAMDRDWGSAQDDAAAAHAARRQESVSTCARAGSTRPSSTSR